MWRVVKKAVHIDDINKKTNEIDKYFSRYKRTYAIVRMSSCQNLYI